MQEETYTPVRLSLAALHEHIAGFIALSEQHKRKETAGTYRRALKEFLVFFTRDRKFLFTIKDVERYRKHLLTRNFSDASVATYMTALRRLCQYLVESGVIERNPARHVAGAKRPQSHSRNFLFIPEIAQLLESLDTRTFLGARDNAIIRLMLGSACSEIELRAMNIGDIQKQGNRWQMFVQGKGKGIKDTRTWVPQTAYQAIQHYLSVRGTYTEQDPLFISMSNRSKNARMTIRGIRQTVVDRIAESGITEGHNRKLSPFCIRHTSGLLLAESGATPEEIMQRMRIEWRPTAMLYIKKKGKLLSEQSPEALSYIALEQ
jgi:site-specific recombinase XerD